MEPTVRIAAGVRRHASLRSDSGRVSAVDEAVADEVPIALVYNGISHAVMLATPNDLEDFALGFSLSEGIVQQARDFYGVEVTPAENGISIELTIAGDRFVALKERRRNLAGRTGCGVCGTESLEHVFRGEPRVGRSVAIDADAPGRAMAQLQGLQPLHGLTGAMHAAGWSRPDGQLELVREDVGRHNALDKLIGALTRAKKDVRGGFAVFTSRASSEMVHKAATMGIELVAAISAPTSLAIRLAERSGVTLVGFVRGSRHQIYSHAGRIGGAARRITVADPGSNHRAGTAEDIVS